MGTSASRWALGGAEGAVVVAVAGVRVVQVALDEVVDVVAVGDGLVAAVGAVGVLAAVGAARVLRGAVAGVGGLDGDGVLFDAAVLARVVEMAVVQVVGVAVVLDGGVAAAVAVHVVFVLVVVVMAHSSSPVCAASGSRACSSALRMRSATCWSASE